MDLLDECITDDVMNEEGIGCDNITATIIVFSDQDGKPNIQNGNHSSSSEPVNFKKQSIKKKSSQKDKGGNDGDNELVMDPELTERLAQKCGRPKISPEKLPQIVIHS